MIRHVFLPTISFAQIKSLLPLFFVFVFARFRIFFARAAGNAGIIFRFRLRCYYLKQIDHRYIYIYITSWKDKSVDYLKIFVSKYLCKKQREQGTKDCVEICFANDTFLSHGEYNSLSVIFRSFSLQHFLRYRRYRQMIVYTQAFAAYQLLI